MICPQCGYDMGSAHRCVRCGYEVKTLVALSEEERKKREQAETKVIDPNNTYLTDEYGNSLDDDDDFLDPFGAIFGDLFGFGDPFADLLGGLFGVDVRRQSSARVQAARDEEEDGNVVEVKKVEIYDENGNPVKQDSKLKKTVNKVKEKVKDFTGKNNDNKND